MPLYGVPLEEALNTQKREHPDLKQPYVLEAGYRHMIVTGLGVEGLFRVAALKEKVVSLKALFDAGLHVDFVKEKTEAVEVSDLCKIYFRELPKCILDPKGDMFDEWCDASDAPKHEKPAKYKSLIARLPAVNIDVLQRLIFFLQQLMFNSHINKMHASNLGLVWGPNLLFKPEQETVDPNAMFSLMATTAKIKVISTDLIENYRSIFEPTLKQIAFQSKTYALFDAKLVGHAKSIIGGAAVRLGDQTHLWSVDSKAVVHVHRVENREFLAEFSAGHAQVFQIKSIGDTIWTCGDGSAKLWDAAKRECIKEIPGFSYCCCATSKSSVWIGGEYESAIRSYDTSSGELKTIASMPSGKYVVALCLDSAGKNVWSASTDHMIRVYDAHSGEPVKEIVGTHKKKINMFAAIGCQMWSAADDASLCVWDSDQLELIKPIAGGHTHAVYAICPVGATAWSCSWDSTIRIWDTRTLSCLSVLRGYHSDAVSGILPIYNELEAQWEVWTCSWDRSLVAWAVNSVLTEASAPSEPIAKIEGQARALSSAEASALRHQHELEKALRDAESKEAELRNRCADLTQRKNRLLARKEELLAQEKRLQAH